jgi:hypothetical protein
MPGRNGTGPMGTGVMTGRGRGFCSGAGNLAKGAGPGLGMACGRGFGRGFRRFPADEVMTENHCKEFLQLQKDMLETRLADIDRQLESL